MHTPVPEIGGVVGVPGKMKFDAVTLCVVVPVGPVTPLNVAGAMVAPAPPDAVQVPEMATPEIALPPVSRAVMVIVREIPAAGTVIELGET